MKRPKQDPFFEATFGQSVERAPARSALAVVETQGEQVGEDEITSLIRRISVSHLPSASSNAMYFDTFDGERTPGGMGAVPILSIDYWTLRQRSVEAYTRNLHAYGTINRILTAIIGTGLGVEAMPEREFTGLSIDESQAWSDRVETLCRMWGARPETCDHAGELTYAQLQRLIYLTALLAGDILIIAQQDPGTGMPRLRTFPGDCVRTPFVYKLPEGHTIRHGVERDKSRKIVAYHIQVLDGTILDGLGMRSERIPAFDGQGQPLAWLFFATPKRWDEERGMPLLSLALQSFKQLDSYRTNMQIKAALAATLALVVTRDADAKTPGTNPLANVGAKSGFSKNVSDLTNKPAETTGAETTMLNTMRMFPGIMVDGLAPGEDVKAFDSRPASEDKLGDHEAAVLNGVGFGYSVPPEVLRMTFNANYSASRAAEVNFKVTVDQSRTDVGDRLLRPTYNLLLISFARRGLIAADGLLRSMQRPDLWYEFAAWTYCELSGAVKPDVDPVKQTNAYVMQVARGWITNQQVTRQLGNGRFDKNIEVVARENLAIAAANKPLQPEPPPKPELPAGPGGEDEEEARLLSGLQRLVDQGKLSVRILEADEDG